MIPAEELRRTETKCNMLLRAEEDYRHLLRSLEQHYGAKIREQRVCRIVHGSTGPVQVLLEEEPPGVGECPPE